MDRDLKIERIRPKKKEQDELPHKEMVKSETMRLASGKLHRQCAVQCAQNMDNTEEKAKVVTAGWGAYLNAALTIQQQG